MRMNKKKTLFLLLSVAVVVMSMTYFFQHSKSYQFVKATKFKEKTQPQEKNDSPQFIKEKNKTKRSVASTPSSKISTLKKFQDRHLVGSLDLTKDFPIANHLNKNWKELAHNRLQPMLKDDTSLEIEVVKPVILVKHNIGRYVEHVKVILKKKNGLLSAYDAYIDSESGAIIRTWNRTKFEIKPGIRLNAKGNEFIGLPLNKDLTTTTL